MEFEENSLFGNTMNSQRPRKRQRNVTNPVSKEKSVAQPSADLSIFNCPVCLDLPEVPMLGTCGHLICDTCHKKITDEKCPICRGGMKYVIPNYSLMKFLNQALKRTNTFKVITLETIQKKSQQTIDMALDHAHTLLSSLALQQAASGSDVLYFTLGRMLSVGSSMHEMYSYQNANRLIHALMDSGLTISINDVRLQSNHVHGGHYIYGLSWGDHHTITAPDALEAAMSYLNSSSTDDDEDEDDDNEENEEDEEDNEEDEEDNDEDQ